MAAKQRTEKKPVAGVFGFGGCFGCQLQIIKLEDFPEVAARVDFNDFMLANEENDKEGALDVAFVEGGVVKKDQVRELKSIRSRAKFLVAIGSCSCDGGIPAQKSFLEEEAVEREVYGAKAKALGAASPRPIDEFVQVDYYLRGCPIERMEFHRVLKELLQGKIPHERHNSVCMECRIKENPCYLEKGVACFGPISAGGCNALCPSHNFPCENCRGPYEDANLEAFEDVLKRCGVSDEMIKQRITRFAGRAKKFKDYCAKKGWTQ